MMKFHTTNFNKNYERRFKGTTVFNDIFAQILSQAYKLGFINDENVFVDSTHIKASANKHKRVKINVTESISKYTKQLKKRLTKTVERMVKAFEFEETLKLKTSINH